MSDGIVRVTLYLLLVFIDFLLFVLKSVGQVVVFLLKQLLNLIFDVNMTESSKKRKRNNSGQNENPTVAVRGIISANWQKLLTSNIIMDKKTEKPAATDKKDHFTGTFRRARKKKTPASNSVENNLKTLNLNNKTNNSVEHKDVIADTSDKKVDSTVKNENNNKKNTLTKFIAMDCEMVGVGYDGNDHMLARVSLVNKFGDCIYDKFVKAREEVIDYRTEVSGIRKEDMLNGEDFTTVQKEVAEIIKGRILVGHSLKNDLSVLFLSHPKRNIRDTSRYKPFRKVTKGSTPSLKRLAKEILGIDIQHGEHSSVEDARAAMQLYCTVAKKWEASMSDKRGYSKKFVED
ncbi:hypothetical protein ABMA28_012549 [Loxostege sticticalis]|uniref:RNA exonuclease 4 n=1 Tax=Loxostege sticticalis TaxID=481309 RepID=A0ABD0S477_LOXSC